jgi:predicted aspartyl protease
VRRLGKLVLAALVGLAGCATSGGDDFDYETCGVRPRIVIPVEMRGNVPLMIAMVKQRPATLILDTGADGVVLTEAALQRFDLKTDSRIISSNGIGGQSRYFAGNMQDLTVGGVAVPDHQISVLPNSSVLASRGMVDGLFGVSVLSVFETELDMPRNRVTLYAGHLCPQTVLPPWTTPYTSLDIEDSPKHKFLVKVRLDGRELTALLDTGSAVSLVSTPAASGLGVSDAELAQAPKATLAGTGPNTAAASLHVFHAIAIGDIVIDAPRILVAAQPVAGIDMVIGSDFLGHRRVWLSWARRKVFIERAVPAGL